jgi:methylphosphotriester-DNA--protein-cysteine methyltransferase
MPNYDSIKPENRVEFKSRADAEAAGYRPARNCH